MSDFNSLLMPLIRLEQARQPIMLSGLPGFAFLRRIVFEFQKKTKIIQPLYTVKETSRFDAQ
jgi:hypothetical protein